MTLNVCGSLVWNLLHVTLLAQKFEVDFRRLENLFCLAAGKKLICPIEFKSLVVCLDLLLVF